ncbi:hypothetical protein [Streptomyces viridosporus]|uniref:hypothetical protein n=1 Tax=Streptomyces viridosporus TaxID=67581 RepID=UPI0036FA943E
MNMSIWTRRLTVAAATVAAAAGVMAAPLTAEAAAPQQARTCKQGYVWREATPNDYVCVHPSQRTQARNDNAHATERWLPGTYICKQGYVWRETQPNDYVCVLPSVRTQVRYDNAHAAERWA